MPSNRSLQHAYDEGFHNAWKHNTPDPGRPENWTRWHFMARDAGWAEGRRRVEAELRQLKEDVS